MAKLKVAVLGASNIGRFHVREFRDAGAEVVAILGSTKASVENTAEGLRADFGVSVRGYVDLATLLASEELDAVSICTPAHLHYQEVKACLEAGLHVFCEKPLVEHTLTHNYDDAKELVALSEKQGKILAVNTQWPSILPYVKKHIDLSELKSFSMHTQPAGLGVDMLTEQLAHPNSILVGLMPDGSATDIAVRMHDEKTIDVNFVYTNAHGACAVHYNFSHKPDRPRKIAFSFNGMEWRREVDEQYRQRLVSGVHTIDIPDPFAVSVRKFIGAIEGGAAPLVSPEEILENIALQDAILAAR